MYFCSLTSSHPLKPIVELLSFNFLGKWLGSRQIRCNWATKGAVSNEDSKSSDAKSVVELTNGSSGEAIGRFFSYFKRNCA